MNTAKEEISSIKLTELFINQTNRTIFLTGKAGTGKTTLLHKIVQSTQKNTVIVAPTGIAALNAGGVTIHSFFQLPFGAFIPDNQSPNVGSYVKHENKTTLKRHFKMNKRRISIIRNLELLIIDEVSMLRADLLDAIDFVLKFVRRNNDPFGGVQVLFIGDLLQLPPVVKNEEWNLLNNYYYGIYFFNSQVLTVFPPLVIELTKIFRQQDDEFIDLLNNLRNNRITEENITLLNSKVIREIDSLDKSGYITLSTHNSKADEINAKELNKITSRSSHYSAEITGDFPEHIFPIDQRLELKVGAQVMFVKNDIGLEKKYYNGKIGTIDFLSEYEVIVSFPEEKKKITVEKYEWSNIKYNLNEATQEITDEIIGTFVQYPLKLAWAITVHKSQGLTFDKAILDVNDVFAPGQAYVAFSRLRSLDGLKMLRPIQNKSISMDQQVKDFTQIDVDLSILNEQLTKDTTNYLQTRLIQTFDWYSLLELASVLLASHNGSPIKSEKNKNLEWVKQMVDNLSNVQEHSYNFRKQIEKLFLNHVDLQFINERVSAAYGYFFPYLDEILGKLYLKIGELKLIRKTKQYTDELEEFSELLFVRILDLKKTRILTEKLSLGNEISKDLFKIPEIENYQISKISAVQQVLRQQNKKSKLVLDVIDFETTITKTKKDKPVKQSTSEITLELLKSGMKIDDIARSRQLSETTIYGHLTQLIRAEKIELSEVMTESRIKEIRSLLGNVEGTSLSQIKSQIGDLITWDELRIYQASTII
jgi:uncharacterized protein YpbB